MENIKLTDEEKQTINRAQQANNNLIFEFGQLYRQRKQLDEKEEKLEENWSELQENVNEMLNDLRDKYGEGSIDLQKGEFIPNEEK